MILSHDLAGSGPTVVLLHSMVCDRRMWDPQMPVLVNAGYRVMRCDLRGFGETPMPDRPHNNAQDVTELLDLLGIEHTALIAESGGGPGRAGDRSPLAAAGDVAGAAVHRVSGTRAQCELRAFGDREDALLEAGDIAGATELNVDTWLGPHADDATREKVRQMQRHAFEVNWPPSRNSSRSGPRQTLLPSRPLACLISGSHEFADFRQIAAELSDQLADARHLELAWAGHLPSLERPDALNPC